MKHVPRFRVRDESSFSHDCPGEMYSFVVEDAETSSRQSSGGKIVAMLVELFTVLSKVVVDMFTDLFLIS